MFNVYAKKRAIYLGVGVTCYHFSPLPLRDQINDFTTDGPQFQRSVVVSASLEMAHNDGLQDRTAEQSRKKYFAQYLLARTEELWTG